MRGRGEKPDEQWCGISDLAVSSHGTQGTEAFAGHVWVRGAVKRSPGDPSPGLKWLRMEPAAAAYEERVACQFSISLSRQAIRP